MLRFGFNECATEVMTKCLSLEVGPAHCASARREAEPLDGTRRFERSDKPSELLPESARTPRMSKVGGVRLRISEAMIGQGPAVSSNTANRGLRQK